VAALGIRCRIPCHGTASSSNCADDRPVDCDVDVIDTGEVVGGSARDYDACRIGRRGHRCCKRCDNRGSRIDPEFTEVNDGVVSSVIRSIPNVILSMYIERMLSTAWRGSACTSGSMVILIWPVRIVDPIRV